MDRADTTKFLSNLLIEKFGSRTYWAREVSVDYGTNKVKRVDFMKFEPNGVIYQSDIEKGIFVCYEIKSCKEDVYSGNGLNFYGEKNYIVTTMQCYKDIQSDIRSGKLLEHIRKCNPESMKQYGIMVPVPYGIPLTDEYENPTELNANGIWELKVVMPCIQKGRKRSTTELLFCMLRSGK